MTPVRFSTAVLAALVLLAKPAPAEHASVLPAEFQARRAALVKAIGSDAAFIAFSSEASRRTGDVDWPFRQEDNLLYLTGVNEPDTTLVLLPGERERREMVFTRDRDPANERWTGVIPSAEQVTAATGIREVVSPRRFNRFVAALLQGRSWSTPSQSSYFAPPGMPSFMASTRAGRAEIWLGMHDQMPGTLTREQRFADDVRRQYPDVRFRDASPLLLAMREIKSPAELILVQRAIDITAEAQKAAMTRVRTATRESEVQATIEFTFRNLGA
jgi:Xaa-Pro aminopeptidase